MHSILIKVVFILAVGMKLYVAQSSPSNFLLDVDPPKFYVAEPTPLEMKEESFKSKEYFDFLNHLYRHDRTKADLFEGNPTEAQPTFVHPDSSYTQQRQKRAIIFRPLFVYRQQQIKKQKLKNSTPNPTNRIQDYSQYLNYSIQGTSSILFNIF